MTRPALPLAIALLAASCGSRERRATPEPQPPRPQAAPHEEPKEPTLPPALQAAAWLHTEPLTLAELKGKVVLLDFWNTTCGPCWKLIPHLAQLYEKHKADGLVVIGISEEEKADVEEFLKKRTVPYPLALDRLADNEGQTFKAYKIGPIPTVWLIGRDGNVVWKGLGEDLRDDMVLAELAKK